MSDLMSFLSNDVEIPMSVPYTPINQNIMSSFSQMPIVADPSPIGPPPGLETTAALDIPPPPIAPKTQSIWETIKQDSQMAVAGIEKVAISTYGGVKKVASTIYDDAESGVERVASDVTTPIKSALSSTYWYTILAVVVLGGVIYFAGKSGALKISA